MTCNIHRHTDTIGHYDTTNKYFLQPKTGSYAIAAINKVTPLLLPNFRRFLASSAEITADNETAKDAILHSR